MRHEWPLPNSLSWLTSGEALVGLFLLALLVVALFYFGRKNGG